MHRLRSRSRTRDIMALGGWLFADLLLALTMLFFVTSIMPVPIKPTPSPDPAPRLDLKPITTELVIDAAGVLHDIPSAINNVKQQMQAQAFLQGRSVGLVIVYGGAPNVALINTALALAQKIYDILRTLGGEWTVFNQASYYNPLYNLGVDFNTVRLDIYLFVKGK